MPRLGRLCLENTQVGCEIFLRWMITAMGETRLCFLAQLWMSDEVVHPAGSLAVCE